MTVEELKLFCGGEGGSGTPAPWSDGGYTFATNGHILIRVPRMAEVIAPEPIPDMMGKVLPFPEPLHWSPLSAMTIPRARKETCHVCDGRGNEPHDECPCCQCECYECGGTGKVDTPLNDIIVGPASFSGKYMSWLSKLPNCEIGPTDDINMAPFRFDGGDGALMPKKTFGGCK